jgi:hypothetical protein
VSRTQFDPARPPPDMPELTPPEAGVCKTTFELQAGVTYSAERLSRTVADTIGRRLIGTTFDGSGADQEAAQRDAFEKVVAEIERDYMARMRSPSAAANERFDEITSHGLDAIDEADAIAVAISAVGGR